MSRRRTKAETKHIVPDIKYNDKVISKFINCLMYDGKKALHNKFLYSYGQHQSKLSTDPYKVFPEALNNKLSLKWRLSQEEWVGLPIRFL